MRAALSSRILSLIRRPIGYQTLHQASSPLLLFYRSISSYRLSSVSPISHQSISQRDIHSSAPITLAKVRRVNVVLLEHLHRTGFEGQEVEVAPGYARNYLIPQKKAVYATEENKEKYIIERPPELIDLLISIREYNHFKSKLQEKIISIKKPNFHEDETKLSTPLHVVDIERALRQQIKYNVEEGSIKILDPIMIFNEETAKAITTQLKTIDSIATFGAYQGIIKVQKPSKYLPPLQKDKEGKDSATAAVSENQENEVEYEELLFSINVTREKIDKRTSK